jgi:hypothetical protein
MRTPEEHVVVLQRRIRERLDELRGVPPGDPAYAAVAGQVLEATAELIGYEERLPILVDEPRHRLSLLAVRWTGVAAAVVATGLALAAIVDWVSLAWLVLLLPLFLIGLRMPWLPVHPPGGPHLHQRTGAILVAASLPVVVLVVTGLVNPWFAAVAVVLVAVGVACLIRDTPSASEEPPTPPVGLELP